MESTESAIHTPVDLCPGAEELKALAAGALSPEEVMRLQAHTAHCEHCSTTLTRLKTAQASDDRTPEISAPTLEASAAPPPQLTVLERGTKVGRYLIIKPLGEGGMGIVYEAYDSQLDRRVALKLLRPGSKSAADDAAVRLLREAQALAQLAHPNVVSAFDVGNFEGGIFLAMALVEGQTLKQWLDPPKPWREVVRVFLAAGRGLAAAHARGLIHRDFKPANVLMGNDGQIFVTDFGLARPERGAAEVAPDPSSDDISSSGSVLQIELTQAGKVMGTLPYLAPEQFVHGGADPFTDQFAYCVSLFEGLHGQRPFSTAAGTPPDERWKLREPPNKSAVPAWLRKIVLRGLSVEPHDRFPSMEALLAELEKDPTARRRRLVAAALGIVAIAGSAYAVRTFQLASPVCAGAERRWAGVWDAGHRAGLTTAFAATSHPQAKALADRAADVLDQYTAAWTAMNTDACLATRVRGEQTDEVLGLRMGCLEQRRAQVAALVETFAKADVAVVRNSARAAHMLGELSSCDNLGVLRNRVVPVKDSAMEGTITAVRSAAARVKALIDVGALKEAAASATALTEQARKSSYRPLEAETLALLGEAQSQLGDNEAASATLEAAVLAAEAAGQRALLASTAPVLVRTLGALKQETAARFWLSLGFANINEFGGDAALQAELEGAASAIELQTGHPAEAVKRAEQALALWLKHGNRDSPELAMAYLDLSSALVQVARITEAIDAESKGLALQIRLFGPEHPDLAPVHETIGRLYASVDDSDAALAQLEAALAVRRAAPGAGDELVASLLSSMARLQTQRGRYDEALNLGQQAYAAFEGSVGLEDPRVVSLFHNLGAALGRLGRYPEAIAFHQRGLTLRQKLSGPTDSQLAVSEVALADALLEAGQTNEALAQALQAVATSEKAEPRNPQVLVDALVCLGEVQLAQHKNREALMTAQRLMQLAPSLQRSDSVASATFLSLLGRAELANRATVEAILALEGAVRIAAIHRVEPLQGAISKFALARALAESNQAPERARALAVEARDQLAHSARVPLRAEVEAWLARP